MERALTGLGSLRTEVVPDGLSARQMRRRGERIEGRECRSARWRVRADVHHFGIVNFRMQAIRRPCLVRDYLSRAKNEPQMQRLQVLLIVIAQFHCAFIDFVADKTRSELTLFEPANQALLRLIILQL